MTGTHHLHPHPSAGAGQNGGPNGSRYYSVDRDAAKHFISASVHTPTVTAFLLVSYNSSRRSKPSWWSDAKWAYATKLNTEILPQYAEAKIAADEHFAALAHKRGAGFRAISLRPGWLTTEPARGVELGKTGSSQAKASREAVAKTAAAVLESGYKGGWLELLDGRRTSRRRLRGLRGRGSMRLKARTPSGSTSWRTESLLNARALADQNMYYNVFRSCESEYLAIRAPAVPYIRNVRSILLLLNAMMARTTEASKDRRRSRPS